jgi:WD40 repeat protein
MHRTSFIAAWLWAVVFLTSQAAPTVTPSSTNEQYLRPQLVMTYGRGTPDAAVWSPDGKALLVHTAIGVWLYDMPAFTLRYEFEGWNSVSFSPDGRWMLGEDQQRRFEIRPAAKLDSAPVISNLGSAIFSPDGRYLLATSPGTNVFTVYETTHFQAVSSLNEFARLGAYPHWFSDNLHLAGLSQAGDLIMWSVEADAPQYEISKGFEGGWLTVSPDGQKFIITTGEKILILKADSGEVMTEIIRPESVDRSEFSFATWMPDSVHLLLNYYSAGSTTDIDLYNALTGKVDVTIPDQAHQYIKVSPDGQYLATSNAIWKIFPDPQMIPFGVEPYHTYNFAWSPNGQTITISDNNLLRARIMDVKTQQISDLKADDPYSLLQQGVWSQDRNRVITWDATGILSLWDKNGQHLAETDNHLNVATSASFSADGTRLAAADAQGKVRLWNPHTLELIATLDGGGQENTISWQPNGVLLVTQHQYNGTSGLKIWDGKDGHLIQEFQDVPTYPVLGWSNDGALLFISACKDKLAQIWDAAQRKVTRRFQQPLIYEGFWWSPDNKLLIATSNEGIHGLRYITHMALYSAIDGTLVASISLEHPAYTYPPNWFPPLVWRNHDQQLRMATNACDADKQNCTIEVRTIFDASSPQNVDGFALPPAFTLGSFTAKPEHIVWDKTGDKLAAIVDHTLYAWSVDGNQSTLLFQKDGVEMYDKTSTDPVWSPNGSRLILHRVDDSFEVLNVKTGGVMAEFLHKENYFSYIRWGGGDQILLIWEHYSDVGENYYEYNIDTGKQTLLWTLQGSAPIQNPYWDMYATSGGVLRLWAKPGTFPNASP